MPQYTTADIRNVALVGHGGAGKTSLIEQLLVRAGAISSAGEIERGTTVCDYEAEEKQHQHSLSAAVVHLDHDGRRVNLIDTPGYPDFLGPALGAMPAAETAVVVINARAGIEMNARRLMQAAADRRMARLVVVNKIDLDETDLEAVLEQVTEAFGAECLPLNLPAGGATAVTDCFFDPSGAAPDFSTLEAAHTRILDQVVEVDEALMELYLEQGEELAPERLHDAFEQALREGHLVPVCFTSAATGVGVAELLEILVRLMPNPAEGNQPTFLRGEEPVAVTPDPSGPVVAYTFKVSIDPFVGRLGVFRIFQGTITKDSQLYVGDARKPFKVGHLFSMQGKEHGEIEAGIPGDICAVAKVDEVHFGSVIRDVADDVLMALDVEPMPAAMFGLAIEGKVRGEEQKIAEGLSRLGAEDPCFVVEHHPVLNETVIRGLGDLHLRIMLEKMVGRFGVEVDTRPPRVEYRETIRKGAEGHHRHKKQTGGAGQFGEVYLRVEPLDRGAGFEFVDGVVGGVIPHQLIPAVEKGIRQVLDRGAIAGYPLQDVRVTVYDGKYHPVDSKEVAFITAGKKAFIDAVSKANPVVLEPIVNIDVTAPQDNMGDIAGGLSSKRGRVSGTTALTGGAVSVSGQAPLSELASYQSELKSVTGGEGSYTMAFSHYDPVPSPIQQQLVSEFKPSSDDD